MKKTIFVLVASLFAASALAQFSEPAATSGDRNVITSPDQNVNSDRVNKRRAPKPSDKRFPDADQSQTTDQQGQSSSSTGSTTAEPRRNPEGTRNSTIDRQRSRDGVGAGNTTTDSQRSRDGSGSATTPSLPR